MNDLERCDFRPFIPRDDGINLVLLRRRNFSFWAIRLSLYLLLLPILGAFVVIPYGVWRKYVLSGNTTGLYAAPVLLLLCWFTLKLMMLGFRLESARRLTFRPGDFTLEGRGALLHHHEHLRDPTALAARTIRNTTEYGDVRGLRLSLRTGEESTHIGHLELDRDAEPTREARVHAAAALMARRLQIPLDLQDEDGHPITPA